MRSAAADGLSSYPSDSDISVYTPAKISNDRLRASWSKICAATINSSAVVDAMNSRSPRRTVSGPPTTEQARASASIARA